MKYCTLIAFILFSITSWAEVSIIPTPQQIKWGKVLEVNSDRIKINFPAKGFKAKVLAQKILSEKLKPISKSPEVVVNLKFNRSLSKTNNYTIDYAKKNKVIIIDIAGNSSRAIFNGLITFTQLLTKKDNGKIALNLAKIVDFPVWQNRFMGNYSLFSENNLIQAAKFKFGGVAYQHREQWQKLSPKSSYYRRQFALLKKYSQYEVLDFMLVYHIYASSETRIKSIFNIASEQDILDLIERCRFAASNGISQIMICADDWTPVKNGVYVCPNKEEREKFGECAGKAHGVLMTRLYNGLKKSFPKLTLSFCPPVYSLKSHAAESPKGTRYLHDLVKNLPAEVPVVWTGPEVISHEITADHYRRFVKLLAGHKTLIWDNSECDVVPIPPWKTKFFAGLEKFSSGIFVNTKTFDGTPWKNLFAINANDYLWNPKQYNNLSSYKKVVRYFFSEKVYRLIIAFKKNLKKIEKMNFRNYDKKLLAELKTQALELKREVPSAKLNSFIRVLAKRFESSRPVTDIKLISKAPIIDGKGTDKCYQGLTENILVGRFGKKVPVAMQTRFKIAFDREAIYVFIKAKLSKPLKRSKMLHASVDLFKSPDLLEIFLSPTSSSRYIQIAFDFEGNKFNYAVGKREWDLKITRTKQYWCAEVAIPFKMLEDVGAKPPSNKTQWRGNICREYNAAKKLQCWSPTFAHSFLTTSMFGCFEFKE